MQLTTMMAVRGRLVSLTVQSAMVQDAVLLVAR